MKTYIDKVTDMVAGRTGIKNSDLVRLYALLVLIKGKDITLKDVHDAWAMNMNFRAQSEWCYGHEHKCIVPFEELSEEIQNKDRKYADILIAIASETEHGIC